MRQKKILIVDDDIIIRNMLKTALANAGYTVITAASGIEAVKSSYEHLPFVIILDIMLPDIDGSEVANILKNDMKTKNIPIIFLSSLISEKEEKIGDKNEIVSFFSKPYIRDRLLNEVRKYYYRGELAKSI